MYNIMQENIGMYKRQCVGCADIYMLSCRRKCRFSAALHIRAVAAGRVVYRAVARVLRRARTCRMCEYAFTIMQENICIYIYVYIYIYAVLSDSIDIRTIAAGRVCCSVCRSHRLAVSFLERLNECCVGCANIHTLSCRRTHICIFKTFWRSEHPRSYGWPCRLQSGWMSVTWRNFSHGPVGPSFTTKQRCSKIRSTSWRCTATPCFSRRCSMLQRVAVCCRSTQRHGAVLQCAAVCCCALHCVTVCCSVLQCVAVWCRMLQIRFTSWRCTATLSCSRRYSCTCLFFVYRDFFFISKVICMLLRPLSHGDGPLPISFSCI